MSFSDQRDDGARMRRWVLLFAVVMFAILQFHGPMGGTNDDARYASALDQLTFAGWLVDRYNSWSGRLLVDAVTLLVIPHPWLWRLLNAAMGAVLIWATVSIFGPARGSRVAAFMGIGFFTLDQAMVFESAFWMSGSFNYLWPAALGMLACVPFARPELSRRVFMLSIPAGMYAAYQEQTAALLLAFQLVLGARLWARRCFGRWHALQMTVVAASMVALVMSPGSVARFTVNVRYWFPEYGLLTLPERAFSGLHLALGHLFGPGQVLGMLFCLLLGLVASSRDRTSGRWIAWVPLAIASLSCAVYQTVAPDFPATENLRWLLKFTPGRRSHDEFWIGNVANAADTYLYLNFLLLCVGGVCVAIALYRLFRREGRWPAMMAVLAWVGAIMSAAIVGLTPTLYASGARIFFTQDILVLALGGALFARLQPKTQQRALIAMSPVAALGAAVALGAGT